MSKKIIIIGGGPGGYVAAIRAVQLGAQVTLIEKDALGGTCLNRGCIPTKTLVHASEIISQIRNAAIYGIKVDGFSVDYDIMFNRKKLVIKQLRAGIDLLMKKNGIEVINETASLIDANTVAVSEKNTILSADNIIIATGSEPIIPQIEGIQSPGVVTSDDVVSLEKPPQRVVVIGSGIIGLEFAQIWHRMGSKVTVLEVMPHILPTEDTDITNLMKNILKEEGISVFTNALTAGIKNNGQGEIVVLFTQDNKKQELVADKVLVAVGRRPFIHNIGLEKLNIAIKQDAILVNNKMQTNIAGIYAVGDVTGGFMLAHVAMVEGRCAAENIMGINSKMNYAAVPRCVYTLPEMAGVGLTEAEAKEKYGQVKVGKFSLIGNGRAMTLTDKPVGLVKIIADSKYGQILGVHILASNATELIAEATLAIQLESTYWDLIATMHSHPTISEAIMEGAMAAAGQAIHI